MSLAKALGYTAGITGLIAAPGIAGTVMAGQEGAGLNESVAIGTATMAGAGAGAGLGAGLGALAGAGIGVLFPAARRRPAMKIGALAGAASAAVLATALVGRGLSSVVHAPRRLTSMQNAIPRHAEGGIQGMDL